MEMDSIAAFAVIGIAALLALANFVFFVLVCMEMFKRGQTGLAITCLALTFLCGGIGELIAFVMGWMKAGEWNIKGTMYAWTGVLVVTLMFGCLAGLIVPMLGHSASATFTTVGQTIGR
jgi:hypothetical protein